MHPELKYKPIAKGGLVYLIEQRAKPQKVDLAHTKNEKHSFTGARANQTVTHALRRGALSNRIRKT